MARAEQTDVALDAAGEDRHAVHGGLTDDVRPALVARGEHHKAARRERAQGGGARARPEPAIARVAVGLAFCARAQAFVEGSAEVRDLDPRVIGQGAHGHRYSQGILDGAQVGEDADGKGSSPAGRPLFDGLLFDRLLFDRLVNHARLVAQSSRQASLAGRLQEDQAVSELEATQHRSGSAAPDEIDVEIRARQSDDQRPRGVAFPESPHRGCALPGVQGDEKVVVYSFANE